MQPLGLNEIRSKYLDFFKRNDHLVKPSYPLVPLNDKTVLLIPAGMVPLKEYFTGKLTPPSVRMATCQKCIRTNDIENVGRTARHASFFEMLGNFSFGDYFKKDAIRLAWEFVTKELEIEKDKLWVTVYLEDDEAYDLWLKQEGVPAERIVKLGKEDNFWEIGTGVGPCGPCSEIYYDRGEDYGCGCEDCKPGCDCDRFVEFWNLVFTQFNQMEDGSYEPLENPNIDTGMGLERVACLMQNVLSIFDVDTMVDIRNEVVKISGKEYGVSDKDDVSIRKITDHGKAVTFLIGDGVLPNNEGRGYVLRSLLRRAARHGKLLGVDRVFLTEIAEKVIDIYGKSYPELVERSAYIKKVILTEEERFAQTIDQGLLILNGYLDELKEKNETVLDGDLVFKLYDTYGFPLDLTNEITTEKGFTVDTDGFNVAMEAQRERARSSRDANTLGWSGDSDEAMAQLKSEFVGYGDTASQAKVLAFSIEGNHVDEVKKGDVISFVLDKTPFYAESGGQVSDIGFVINEHAKIAVNDTKNALTGTPIHYGEVIEGEFSVGDTVYAEVDVDRRMDIARNHTATHLLHRALKDVLGDHVEQAGSLVEDNRLRFDFTHFSPMTEEERKQVETIVNQKVLDSLLVNTKEMPLDEAKALGAMSLFGEKYGEIVRVVTVGDYSKELCGGTHLENTAQMGLFKITSEVGVAAGVRRIEAMTGRAVKQFLNELIDESEVLAKALKVNREDLVTKVQNLIEENKMLQRELEKGKQQAANSALDSLRQNAKEIRGVNVVVGEFSGQNAEVLRNLGDQLIDDDKATLAILANVDGEKVAFIAMANKAAVAEKVHCGNIVKALAKTCSGGGGGRPNLAQAGGKDSSKLKIALQQLPDLV